MDIPEDPVDRKKWMLAAWHSYGDQFAIFERETQQLPDLPDVWNKELWEAMTPEPDENRDHDPRIIRDAQWVAPSRDFLAARYGVRSAAAFFDCKVLNFHPPLTNNLATERWWYGEALSMGWYTYGGKQRIGIGFSCRSKRCRRRDCPLNLTNRKRQSRVDIHGLVSIFEGVAIAEAVRIVSTGLGIPLHPFGDSYYEVPKKAVYDLMQRYRSDAAKLVRNFTNRCRRSPLVYFPDKPPAETADECAFFRKELLSTKTLETIGSAAVVVYLHLLMRQQEERQHNRRLPALKATALSKGLGIPVTSLKRYLRELVDLGLLVDQKSIRDSPEPCWKIQPFFGS